MAATHAERVAAKSQQERLAFAQTPHNLQASQFSLMPAKSRLCPVRLAQVRQLAAAEKKLRILRSNGASFRMSRTLRSIHT